MTEHGCAKSRRPEGRPLGQAYAGGREMELPKEPAERIDADPAAKAAYATLSAQNRYALAFRLHN
jgi:uncharacterized protein YdeI (YjbR/CyaY-like superfamily)